MKNTLKMISSKAKVAEDIIKHGEKWNLDHINIREDFYDLIESIQQDAQKILEYRDVLFYDNV
jgi:hypothetical protein